MLSHRLLIALLRGLRIRLLVILLLVGLLQLRRVLLLVGRVGLVLGLGVGVLRAVLVGAVIDAAPVGAGEEDADEGGDEEDELEHGLDAVQVGGCGGGSEGVDDVDDRPG